MILCIYVTLVNKLIVQFYNVAGGISSEQSMLVGKRVSAYPSILRTEPACRKR